MRGSKRIAGALVALACLAAAGPVRAAGEPPVKHVWVLILENKNYDESFGPASPAPYLAKTLRAQGQLLPNFYATTHLSLGNYIALVSGQASNPVTQADAPAFTDVFPGTIGADGQAIGQGSVYPANVKTIADQLDAKGLTWKGYMEDMGNSATEPKTCRHPAPNAMDSTQSARRGDQYAARHNPFVYFHSVIDDRARCDAHDVPLDRLQPDLASVATTPNYSFITPNLCNDGHDAPCVDGKPGGLRSADDFLKLWVPRITASPAYRAGGLLIVTFDEAEAAGSNPDATACCNQQPGPNTPNPGGPVPGSGGGKVGSVLLSPWVRPGSVNPTPYNHYSLLRSVQALFGLGPLGYSGQAGLRSFGADVYNGTGPTTTTPACTPPALPRSRAGVLRRGSVVSRLRVVRRAGRAPLLEVRLVRAARLSLKIFNTVRTGRVVRNRSVTLRPRPYRGCRTYRVGLQFRHGRVAVRAAVGSASERRGLRF
ncbi:MAG: phosphatidylinositol-3-phosphatase [Solirubrobacteraceae bacterium]|jgi:phospholipase C|nr:phosphatidylinositol-3-phosphatase [Solirubrobacteraceae bacterium]